MTKRIAKIIALTMLITSISGNSIPVYGDEISGTTPEVTTEASQPGDASQTPEGSSQTPENSSQTPEGSSQAPENSSQTPEGSSQAPENTQPSQPGDASQTPENTQPSQPGDASQAPENTQPSQPGDASQTPENTQPSQPGDASQTPDNTQPGQPTETPSEGIVYEETNKLHNMTIKKGDYKNLTVKGFTVESWTSDNTGILTVTTSGQIKGVAVGTANLEVVYSLTAADGVKKYYKSHAVVTVEESAGVSVISNTEVLREEPVSMVVTMPDRENTYIDENGNVVTEVKHASIKSWETSGKGIVAIDNGKITGLTEGSEKITITYKYAFSDGTLLCKDKATITVKCYKINGTTITMDNLSTQDKDASTAINNALKIARDNATDDKPYTVVFPEGTYNIGAANLRIFSNTTMDLTSGARLLFAGVGGAEGSHPILKMGICGAYDGETDYNNSAKCAGYGGFRNVKILGGTFESTDINTSTHIVMGHATNVTLEGVTLTGGAGMHMMEVAAIKNFKVKDCVFKNFTGSKAISASEETGRKEVKIRYGNYEALQIDIPASADLFGEVYADGTPMQDVEITGCTFDGVPRGVGSHSMLLGAYHTGINISNNTFKNTTKEAIIALAYADCKIKDNTITGCGAGIVFQGFSSSSTYVLTKIFEGAEEYGKPAIYDMNTEISGNEISVTYRGAASETVAIMVYGKNVTAAYTSKRPTTGKAWGNIPKDNYYVGNVKITENNIKTAGYGIHLVDTRDCEVSKNTIKGVNFKTKTLYNGIYCSDGTIVNSILNNTVSYMQGNGIFISDTSTVKKKITSNNVKYSGCSELVVNGAANKYTISSNKFTSKNTTNHVVVFSSDKNYYITFKSNTVKGPGNTTKYGVYISKGAVYLKANTISKVYYAICYVNKAKGPKYGDESKYVVQSQLKLSSNKYSSIKKKSKAAETITYNKKKNEYVSTFK